ncbi:MAG: thiamine phosphate synthase [Janthinobacterium lividum]
MSAGQVRPGRAPFPSTRARQALAADDVFWPSAHALLAAAETIRALLGDWPPLAAPWRFRLAPPGPGVTALGAPDAAPGTDAAQRTDAPPGKNAAPLPDPQTVLIVATPPSASLLAGWRLQGAQVIDVSDDPTVLFAGGERYALRGARPDDWLAALAAFADCGFALHDALCLALAWRGPEAAGELAATIAASTPAPTRPAAAPATLPDAAAGPAVVAPPSPCWPDQLADFPTLSDLPACSWHFPRCPPVLGVYPIVPDAEWVERLIALGVRTIQLRVKHADPGVLHEQVARAVRAARRAPDEVRLFINDHWRQAIDAGAYGVHLGQEDMATADLAAIAAAGLRLGLSTHGYYEILHAWHFRPSYIACGPVFPTTTKIVKTAPQGVPRIAAYQRLLGAAVPVVAIGGIDLASLPGVLATGVRSVAVVSAVTHASELSATVGVLLAAFPA